MYIIPEPQQMEIKEGRYTLRYDRKIVIEPSCTADACEYARLLQEEMRRHVGYGMAITRGQSRRAAVMLAEDSGMGCEEYRLEVGAGGVRIVGGAKGGVLYGVQTLRQMIRQSGAHLPYVSIHDYPQIGNRGFYHDVTRGRIPKLSYLKQLADQIAFYKMNQLQLYIEHTYLFEGLSEMWRDDTPLCAEDILELDAYCRKLNIDLVPNVSCFGHLYKLLRTKSYEHLCELPDSRGQNFGFHERMMHHTINVTNPESLTLVKSLIAEFMPLFTSQYFNIGADETFDLGKGRSLAKAQEIGVKRLYVDFVRQLCEFVVEKGRKPMFWGDIICDFPEVIKELPPQTICLNWGYDKEQSDESTKKLYDAGAVQYSCPGVSGWNQFVNRLDVAYENIRRMCSYAVKYDTAGVLTTDWGDYGHINHPDFGIPGRIYGAAFSWNKNPMDFDEINRRISRVEFGDREERVVPVLAKISLCQIFNWEKTVRYIEGLDEAPAAQELSEAEEMLRGLDEAADEVRHMMLRVPERTVPMLHACLVAIDGVKLFGRAALLISAGKSDAAPDFGADGVSLAAALEEWFMFYKEIWRQISRESELYRIQDVICAYADMLRGAARENQMDS